MNGFLVTVTESSPREFYRIEHCHILRPLRASPQMVHHSLKIAVPVLIDVLTAYLIGALRKCETYAERQQWLQRVVNHLREGAEWP